MYEATGTPIYIPRGNFRVLLHPALSVGGSGYMAPVIYGDGVQTNLISLNGQTILQITGTEDAHSFAGWIHDFRLSVTGDMATPATPLILLREMTSFAMDRIFGNHHRSGHFLCS